MPTDTSEGGLEELITRRLTGQRIPSPDAESTADESLLSYRGAGYVEGNSSDYNREYALDVEKLRSFLHATQPDVAESFEIDQATPERRKFLHRIQGQVAKRGIVDVLRSGIKHGPAHIDLFYGTPSPGNERARELFEQNIFSVTRQLRYSRDETSLALDLCLFINGLPICTFELKNNLTKQTVEDAVNQYKRDRDPREMLFQFGRCLAHFAVDDQEVRFCTELKGSDSWFLPFNKGHNGGPGNPPNPNGLKTAYLWEEVLTREGLTEIIENYAQIVEEKDDKTGKKKRIQIFPRYHQLDVVRKLVGDAAEHGAGKRYLIQHSTGSGKSFSIAWTAHQLVGLKPNDDPEGRDVFDSVIVVTDRRVLDKQIRQTIRQFAHVGSIVGAATRGSRQLKRLIEQGKKIIISTIQKFPYILSQIGDEHRDRRFAILIDEAHSSQGGKTTAAMNTALSGKTPDPEDTINETIQKRMEARRLMSNASYFAFTATPKNKTLELFGTPSEAGNGKTSHRPFHTYSMKQAIEEDFIKDVLKNYTPYESYYRIQKSVEDDPEFDVKKAQKKIRHYVETHEHAVRQKAEIMVNHFHDKIIAPRKVGGKARAMVVTRSIRQAIQYFHAIQTCLNERKSPYKPIVAFSDKDIDGETVTEGQKNGFPSGEIEDRFREDRYRFLVVANKFQTGFDEPLLHTMYVDKPLSGVKAVQTLSRLNRSHPAKDSTFVLDFVNDIETIREAFERHYKCTILSEESDPNKLHDLKADLDGYQVYTEQEVDLLVERYLSDAERDQLDPILDGCVSRYNEMGEAEQVDFKSKSRVFVRNYEFLGSVLPYSHAAWEKLSIFLRFLVPKLPTPPEEDLSKGILQSIDMESYRSEAQATIEIALADKEGTVDPIPTGEAGGKSEPEVDKLSTIVRVFNERFGDIDWNDKDKIQEVIKKELPERVSADTQYQNAIRNSDKQNARVEHDKALKRAIVDLLSDHTELFKQFSDNPSFKKWLGDAIFSATYEGGGAS